VYEIVHVRLQAESSVRHHLRGAAGETLHRPSNVGHVSPAVEPLIAIRVCGRQRSLGCEGPQHAVADSGASDQLFPPWVAVYLLVGADREVILRLTGATPEIHTNASSAVGNPEPLREESGLLVCN